MNNYNLSDPSSPALIQTALSILKPHFPQCLPLYRRLQYGRFSPTSHLLTNLSLHSPQPLPSHDSSSPFVIAFIDRSVRPETECWLYGSFEHRPLRTPSQHATLQTILQSFAETVNGLELPESIHEQKRDDDDDDDDDDVNKENVYSSHLTDSSILLFGAVGEEMKKVLEAMGIVKGNESGAIPNHVFIWDVEGFEGMSGELKGGLRWGDVRREDLALVRRRTEIPRQESTLAGLPSLGVFDGDGRIVAWGFVGLDASLTTLHVEEGYRRKGVAKMLTAKLFREKMGRFWEEGMPRIAHGNVIYGNEASRAMCKSLGGKDTGKCYWLRETLHA